MFFLESVNNFIGSTQRPSLGIFFQTSIIVCFCGTSLFIRCSLLLFVYPAYLVLPQLFFSSALASVVLFFLLYLFAYEWMKWMGQTMDHACWFYFILCWLDVCSFMALFLYLSTIHPSTATPLLLLLLLLFVCLYVLVGPPFFPPAGGQNRFTSNSRSYSHIVFCRCSISTYVLVFCGDWWIFFLQRYGYLYPAQVKSYERQIRQERFRGKKIKKAKKKDIVVYMEPHLIEMYLPLSTVENAPDYLFFSFLSSAFFIAHVPGFLLFWNLSVILFSELHPIRMFPASCFLSHGYIQC